MLYLWRALRSIQPRTEEGAGAIPRGERLAKSAAVCLVIAIAASTTACGGPDTFSRAGPAELGTVATNQNAPAAGHQLRCPEHEPKICDSRCVDPQSDSNHCGTCGQRCGAVCKRGRCAEVLQVAMGGNHGCARFDDGALRCWGGDLRGQVGDGTPNITHAIPIEVAELGKVTRVATGTNSTCAVLEDRTVQCWGDILQRVDANARTARPLPVLGLTSVADVSVGFTTLCAVTVSGAVLCLGENDAGQLGDGTRTRRSEARPVRGVSDAVEVAVAANHACARSRDGSVRCWGANGDRQLGDVGIPQRLLPAKVPRLPPAKQLAMGARHTCALLEDGTVRCWGANESGQLGDGSREPRVGPVAVADLSSAIAISAGRGDGTCALRADGKARCWGNFGAFAFRRQGVQLVPETARDIEGIAEISVGAASICARKTDGSIWCWGQELDPRGTPVERLEPTPLAW